MGCWGVEICAMLEGVERKEGGGVSVTVRDTGGNEPLLRATNEGTARTLRGVRPVRAGFGSVPGLQFVA